LLHWKPPGGVWTGVEVNIIGRVPVNVSKVLYTVLYGFQPAKTYQVSTYLRSGDMRSNVHVLDCSTDPRGILYTVYTVYIQYIYIYI